MASELQISRIKSGVYRLVPLQKRRVLAVSKFSPEATEASTGRSEAEWEHTVDWI